VSAVAIKAYRHRCIVCERDMPRNAENQRTCFRADPRLTRPTILPLRYPKVGTPLGKAVKPWSSTVWATTVVVFVSGMESHAQTSPACIVVEIPTDPSDLLPNKTSPDLDRLYAKADTEKSSVIAPAILPSGRTGPAKKASGGQDEIAVTLSVREKEFLSSQPWSVYCPSMSYRNRPLQL
jgi:hypothetical protein